MSEESSGCRGRLAIPPDICKCGKVQGEATNRDDVMNPDVMKTDEEEEERMKKESYWWDLDFFQMFEVAALKSSFLALKHRHHENVKCFPSNSEVSSDLGAYTELDTQVSRPK
ncbi:hypothetical protein RUM43_005460 [Polyplax serrata]|uniref:Uncharacterized protein n=1 Tax=Polyplax serrata TaxID=468196 RepID=A0AAN8PDK5_POLSC